MFNSSRFRRQPQGSRNHPGCALRPPLHTLRLRGSVALVVPNCLWSTRSGARRTTSPRTHVSGKRETRDSNVTPVWIPPMQLRTGVNPGGKSTICKQVRTGSCHLGAESSGTLADVVHQHLATLSRTPTKPWMVRASDKL